MQTPTPALPLSPEHHTAADVVRLFSLKPLDQEGGWFRRTLESELVIASDALPSIYGGKRRAYSVIYGLFTPDGFSALHRLVTDEIWCYHAGDALESLRLHPDGTGEWVQLGPRISAGQRLQNLVPAHSWQGTRLVAGGRWSLVTCVVAPEFSWTDFELGECEPLAARYPDFAAGIRALTRDVPLAGRR